MSWAVIDAPLRLELAGDGVEDEDVVVGRSINVERAENNLLNITDCASDKSIRERGKNIAIGNRSAGVNVELGQRESARAVYVLGDGDVVVIRCVVVNTANEGKTHQRRAINVHRAAPDVGRRDGEERLLFAFVERRTNNSERLKLTIEGA